MSGPNDQLNYFIQLFLICKFDVCFHVFALLECKCEKLFDIDSRCFASLASSSFLCKTELTHKEDLLCLKLKNKNVSFGWGLTHKSFQWNEMKWSHKENEEKNFFCVFAAILKWSRSVKTNLIISPFKV